MLPDAESLDPQHLMSAIIALVRVGAADNVDGSQQSKARRNRATANAARSGGPASSVGASEDASAGTADALVATGSNEAEEPGGLPGGYATVPCVPGGFPPGSASGATSPCAAALLAAAGRQLAALNNEAVTNLLAAAEKLGAELGPEWLAAYFGELERRCALTHEIPAVN